MLTDKELSELYPNYSISDVRYYQAIGQLWACKGNTIQAGDNHKAGALPEQWRDYNRSQWPCYIGYI